MEFWIALLVCAVIYVALLTILCCYLCLNLMISINGISNFGKKKLVIVVVTGLICPSNL